MPTSLHFFVTSSIAESPLVQPSPLQYTRDHAKMQVWSSPATASLIQHLAGLTTDQAPWLKHAPRKACPTKAVYVPRPGLVIMPKEVFVSKGSTNFLKNLCRLHLLQCLVNEVLRLKG